MGTSNLAREGFRIGEVTSTDPKKGTARVKFPDMDAIVSYELFVLQHKSLEDKDYWMPDIKEQVACLFLGNGLETGLILGAIYSDVDRPPVECQDKRHVRFKDGTWLEYDRAEHKLRGHVEGDVELNATGMISMTAAGDINIRSTGGMVYINGIQVRMND